MSKKPGRKSAAELEVSPLALGATTERPDAPYDLTDEEADVWRGTVDALPADWITAPAFPVLAAYCRTAVNLRRLGQLVTQAAHEAEPYDPKFHFDCIREHGRQSQVLKTLATSLRLTPQTRFRADAAGRAARDFNPEGRKPWHE